MENAASMSGWSPPKNTRFHRRMMYVRHLAMTALLVRRGYALCTLGETRVGCSWTFCPRGLAERSVVYSGGVGNDISFEHELVKKFGCQVTLFDPSPTGLATMNRPENKISAFKYLPVGLAGHCGMLRLTQPLNAEEGSWFAGAGGAEGIAVRCLDLTTMLKENGHQQVDLLKIDIEGAEYGVISHILEGRVPVRQLLVEFHDGLLPGFSRGQTLRTIFKLMTHGYKLISERSNTLTFVRD